VCRQGEADKGRCPVDSGPAERVGHGRLTPDLRGGQDSPPKQGGTRAYRDVFTACPDEPIPERVALLAMFLVCQGDKIDRDSRLHEPPR